MKICSADKEAEKPMSKLTGAFLKLFFANPPRDGNACQILRFKTKVKYEYNSMTAFLLTKVHWIRLCSKTTIESRAELLITC
jgi:hypothetical protein